MSRDELNLIRYYQEKFLVTYLCKPPIELLQAIVFLHRLQKSFEKIANNIQIQLANHNSNLNIELAAQRIALQNRMMN